MTLTKEASGLEPDTRPEMSWYEEFYAGLDAKDVGVVERLCTADTRVQFANHEPVVGREAVRDVMSHFWATIERMQHKFTNVLEVGDQSLLEADVTYTRLDGSQVMIKAATVIRRRDDLVADQRIYVDLAPLTLGASAPEQPQREEGGR